MTISILLVEDSPIAVVGARAVLSYFDTILYEAETGKKALELSAKQKFDLILMDIGLPDIDGFTLTQNIHHTCPLNQTTKIIAVTAHAEKDYQTKIIECGLTSLIIKPLTTHNFVVALQSAGIKVPARTANA